MSASPIERFTLLVLFQAQQDQATELTISPLAGERSPIRYKVGGVWYDMSPPPQHVVTGVIEELGRLAAFSKKTFPMEGLINVPYSGLHLRWILRMESADGDCLLTPG